MAREKKQKKSKESPESIALKQGDILSPLSLDAIGSDHDPCFGTRYDLTTDACKMCGDNELCCIKFAAVQGKTRKELEEQNHYKDLETLIDKKAVFKSIRAYKKKNLKKPEIIDRLQAKYELAKRDAKMLYKEWKEKHGRTESEG